MNSLFYREPIFQSLFEAATLGILMVDAEGSIVLANSYCLRLFGYAEEELIGQPLEQLIPPRVRQEHARLRRNFIAAPQVRPMGIGRRLRGLRRDGTQFAVEVSLSHTTIDGQRYAIAFVVDVTEHQEIRYLNTLLTRIFQESLHAIYVIDAPTLRFVRANQGALRSLGYTLSELQSLHPWDIKPHEDEASFRQRIEKVLDETEPKVSFESVFARKDGRTFPVEVHLQSFRYDTQHVLVQIVIDITERKRAETALRKEKEKLQTYLNVAAAVFVVVEKDQTVSLVNQCGSKLLGYPEEEIVGKDWFATFIPDSERPRVLSVFKQLMNEEADHVTHFENRVQTRDKGKRLIEWHNTLVRDESGAPVATLSSGIDITDKRKAERAVNQALIEGQEAERRRIARELHDGLGQS
jgi:PAS domain S-box-containing protein